MTRYKLQPLIERTGLTGDQFRRQLGISGTAWTGMRANGVQAATAERYAELFGQHPLDLWPNMALEYAAVEAVQCAHPKCDIEFVPRREVHRYCSTRCQQNVAKAKWKRKRYQTDPEYREQAKALARRRYESERAYIRRQQNEARRKKAS